MFTRLDRDKVLSVVIFPLDAAHTFGEIRSLYGIDEQSYVKALCDAPFIGGDVEASGKCLAPICFYVFFFVTKATLWNVYVNWAIVVAFGYLSYIFYIFPCGTRILPNPNSFLFFSRFSVCWGNFW